MTALVEARSESADMRALAQRIDLSQRDEIAMMEDWLRSHGQEVPALGAHHDHDQKLMPGMLTPEEMRRLEQARGIEFDRLFLELMIAHHQGALVMVDDSAFERWGGPGVDGFRLHHRRHRRPGHGDRSHGGDARSALERSAGRPRRRVPGCRHGGTPSRAGRLAAEAPGVLQSRSARGAGAAAGDDGRRGRRRRRGRRGR